MPSPHPRLPRAAAIAASMVLTSAPLVLALRSRVLQHHLTRFLVFGSAGQDLT